MAFFARDGGMVSLPRGENALQSRWLPEHGDDDERCDVAVPVKKAVITVQREGGRHGSSREAGASGVERQVRCVDGAGRNMYRIEVSDGWCGVDCTVYSVQREIKLEGLL